LREVDEIFLAQGQAYFSKE